MRQSFGYQDSLTPPTGDAQDSEHGKRAPSVNASDDTTNDKSLIDLQPLEMPNSSLYNLQTFDQLLGKEPQ